MNKSVVRSALISIFTLALCAWGLGCAHHHRVEHPVHVVHAPVPPPPDVPPQFHQDPVAAPVEVSPEPLPEDVVLRSPVQDVDIQPAMAVEDEIDISLFEDALTPHGTWMDVEGVQTWQPRLVVHDPLWRPYCDGGRWVYTDCGWTWCSNYAWGWAPFHYGRWRRHVRLGWIWYPGTRWAPAWVDWRCSDRYYGWAPLPPAATVDVIASGGNWGFNLHLGFDDYNFVGCDLFLTSSLRRHCLGRTRALSAYHRTRVLHDTYVFQGSNCFHRGPGRDRVARATGRRIPTLHVTPAPHGPGHTRGAHRVRGTRLEVHRPRVIGSVVRRKPGAPARNAPAPGIRTGSTRGRIARAGVATSATKPVVGPPPHQRASQERLAAARGPDKKPRATGPRVADRPASPPRRTIAPSSQATPARQAGPNRQADPPAWGRILPTPRREDKTSALVAASRRQGESLAVRPASGTPLIREKETPDGRARIQRTRLDQERREAGQHARAEQQRRAEEQQRRADEQRRAEAQRRALEQKQAEQEQARIQRVRLDQQRREAEQHARAEQQRRAEEQQRRADAQRRAEAQQRALEQKQAEQERGRIQRVRLDQQRREAEQHARAEQQRRAEEQQRRADAQRRAEAQQRALQQKQAEQEQARIQRVRLDQQRREAEQHARAEQQRRAEEQQRRADAQRRAEAQQRALQQKQAEQEQARIQRVRLDQQRREAEQHARAEQQRRAEEQQRRADAQRRAEAQQRALQQKQAEQEQARIQRAQRDQQRREAEQHARAEQQRRADAQRRAEAQQRALQQKQAEQEQARIQRAQRDQQRREAAQRSQRNQVRKSASSARPAQTRTTSDQRSSSRSARTVTTVAEASAKPHVNSSRGRGRRR